MEKMTVRNPGNKTTARNAATLLAYVTETKTRTGEIPTTPEGTTTIELAERLVECRRQFVETQRQSVELQRQSVELRRRLAEYGRHLEGCERDLLERMHAIVQDN